MTTGRAGPSRPGSFVRRVPALLVMAGCAVTLWVHAAQAACTVTVAGSVSCGGATTTTGTVNVDGAAASSADRTQFFDNGAPVAGTIAAGATIAGAGLQLTQAASSPAAVRLTNAGQVTATLAGNAVQLDGNGGALTYSGNGSIAGTGGAALYADNVAGSVAITTGSGAVSAAQGIVASTTGAATLAITTGSGLVSGTAGAGILANGKTGALSITVGSGGVISNGAGTDGIQASNTAGGITVTLNGKVTGGSLGTNPALNADGVRVTSNGSGNVVIGGSGSVVALAGRGIWALQSDTGTGSVQVSGTGSSTGMGQLCPASYSLVNSAQNGELGCSAIRAEITNAADSGNVVVNWSGNSSGTSAGITARTTGNGNVSVQTGTSSLINGLFSFGIEAFTSGTGGVTVTTGTAGTVLTGGIGVLAVNEATAVPASAASAIAVHTQGAVTSTANPLALSDVRKNPLGVLAGISAGYLGNTSAVLNPSVNGTVKVVNDAALKAGLGDGIVAFNYGNGTVTVNNRGAITAPVGIAVAGSAAAPITVMNSGAITASQTAIDLSAAGTAVTYTQSGGALAGNILLSGKGDTLNIGGGSIAGNIVGNSAANGMNAGTVNFGATSFTTGGTIDAANVNVSSGTLVLENDVTVAGALTNNATLQLAADGTHTIHGVFAQSAGGTLALAITPTGSAQLAVTGAASLAGNLSLIYAPGSYSTRTYALVTAGGGVSGTFAATSESGAVPTGLSRTVSYGANAVSLVVSTPQVVRSARADVGTALVSSVASYDATSPLAVLPPSSIVTQVPSLATQVQTTSTGDPSDGTGTTAATDPAAGSTTTTVRPYDEALFGAQDTTLALMADQAVATLLGDGPRAACGAPAQAGERAARADPTAALPFCRAGGWMSIAGTPLAANGSTGQPGFRASMFHLLTGLDIPVRTEAARLGVVVGYDRGWSTDSLGGQASEQVLRLGLYGSASLGPVLLSAALTYGHDWNSTVRNTGYGGVAEAHGGDEVSGGLLARLPTALGAYTLTPAAGVRFAVLDQQRFAESASGTLAAFAVSGDRIDDSHAVPYGRIGLSRLFDAGGWRLLPQIEAGYDYRAGNARPAVALTGADGSGFSSNGVKLDRGSALVGTSLTAGTDRIALFTGIRANLGGNWTSRTAQAGVRVWF